MNKTKFIHVEKFIDHLCPESAYLLGFLWADGHINKKTNEITLEIKTEDYLDILDCLNIVGEWNIYTRKRGQWKEVTKIYTSDKKLKCFLSDNDYINKNNPNLILSIIPHDLKHFWYRGYFDGDGSLYINHECNQLVFTGKYEMNWTFIKTIEEKFRIKDIVTSKGHKYSCARITNRTQIIIFLDWLYQGRPNLGLKRKKTIYQTMRKNERNYKNNLCGRHPRAY